MEGDKGASTIFDEMVLRQTLEACGTCKALCEEEPDCRGESFPLLWLPLVGILQEGRERVLLEGLLEVLVSNSFLVSAANSDEVEGSGLTS